MAEQRRIERLNSLLKEVLSEVIQSDVKNPNLSPLTSIMSVEIAKDLKSAKVFISVIGEKQEKQETLKALQSAAGYIGVLASKKVVLRYFPTLSFFLDTSLDKFFKIEEALQKMKTKDTS